MSAYLIIAMQMTNFKPDKIHFYNNKQRMAEPFRRGPEMNHCDRSSIPF